MASVQRTLARVGSGAPRKRSRKMFSATRTARAARCAGPKSSKAGPGKSRAKKYGSMGLLGDGTLVGGAHAVQQEDSGGEEGEGVGLMQQGDDDLYVGKKDGNAEHDLEQDEAEDEARADLDVTRHLAGMDERVGEGGE